VHQFDRKREVAAFVSAAFPLIEPVHQMAWEATLAQWQEAARRKGPSRYAGGAGSAEAGRPTPSPGRPPRPTLAQAQRDSTVVESGTISRTAAPRPDAANLTRVALAESRTRAVGGPIPHLRGRAADSDKRALLLAPALRRPVSVSDALV
jgi:hypothetical protein